MYCKFEEDIQDTEEDIQEFHIHTEDDFEEEETLFDSALEQEDFNDILSSITGESTNENNNSDYIVRLLNMFITYYNLKFNKKDHFFSGVVEDTDTTHIMEMFYEAMHKFTECEEKLHLTNDELYDYYVKKENDTYSYTKVSENKINIEELVNTDNECYLMEITTENSKYNIITPILLVCFHYLLEHEIELDENIVIFNLHNM